MDVKPDFDTIEKNKENPVIKKKKKEPTIEELKNEIRSIKETFRILETGSPKNVSLRWMMKQDGIALHTNKTKLQEAIYKYKKRLDSVIFVQKIIRGFLANIFWKRYKKGFSVSNCVNDTDFYTLEPLNEIDNSLLYFFKSGEHIYGFNVNSLLIYYGKSKTINDNKLLNPYNRDIIERKNVQQMLFLTHLFFPDTFLEFQGKPYYKNFMADLYPKFKSLQLPNNTVRVIRPLTTPVVPTGELIPAPPIVSNEVMPINIPDAFSNTITTVSRETIVYNQPIITGDIQKGIAEHLAEIEKLPLNRRIHELFIDFDLLGNYTDARWFLNQNLRGYKVYFIKLNELWNHLPPFVQQSICCLGDPFYLVDVRNIHQQTFESMRGACLKVMEYITHGGISREDQKLGIYQILIALTFISREARHSMNHLL